jgi:YHS domain-containing protein
VTDSEFALFHMQRVLWDPVDPRELGSLNRALQYKVNGEIYRFSGIPSMRRFVLHPTLWCGVLRDPVTGRRFRPSTRSPQLEWQGAPYFFESDSTRAVFEAAPGTYEVVRRM